jgi:hypothetical protein
VINAIPSQAVAVTAHVADAWQTEHPFSHILRRELERSIRKHTRTGMSASLLTFTLEKMWGLANSPVLINKG